MLLDKLWGMTGKDERNIEKKTLKNQEIVLIYTYSFNNKFSTTRHSI